MMRTGSTSQPTGRNDDAPDKEQIGRGAYVFARSGARGLLLWLFRRQIVDALARHLTAKVAAIAFIASLFTYAAANNLDAEHRRNILRAHAYSSTPTTEMSWEYRGLIGTRHRLSQRRASEHRSFLSSRKRRTTVPSPATSYVSFSDYVLSTIFAYLRFFSGWSLLVVPLFAAIGWVTRTQREALAYEHGEGTPAYEAAVEAAIRESDKRITEDDWLVDPPWRRQRDAAANEQPRFGRRLSETRN